MKTKTNLQIAILAAILVPGTLLAGGHGGKHAPARPAAQQRPHVSRPSFMPVTPRREQRKPQFHPVRAPGKIVPNPDRNGHKHHNHGHHHNYRYVPVGTSVVVYNEVAYPSRSSRSAGNYAAPSMPASGIVLTSYDVEKATVAPQARRITVTGWVTKAVKGGGEEYYILNNSIRCEFRPNPMRDAVAHAWTGRQVAITGTVAYTPQGTVAPVLLDCDSPEPL